VEQVALGDQHDPVTRRDGLDGLAHARQQLDRVLQHRLAELHDPVDVGA
jgi:hypothetical protein